MPNWPNCVFTSEKLDCLGTGLNTTSKCCCCCLFCFYISSSLNTLNQLLNIWLIYFTKINFRMNYCKRTCQLPCPVKIYLTKFSLLQLWLLIRRMKWTGKNNKHGIYNLQMIKQMKDVTCWLLWTTCLLVLIPET